jgi:GTP pyrophosphokinase
MQWKEFRAHVRHLSVSDQDRIHDAFELGKKMHEGQLRKSGEPYFNHPIAVADMLADMGADAETIIAALLHDTVEDTSLTLDEIKAQFGETVYILIDGVTKLSKADMGESPTLNEQIETIRKMFTLMQKDISIMVIKLVDRLHNMETVEFLPPSKQIALARETKEVYVKIADRLCMQDLRDELEALCLSVLEPEAYAKLMTLRKENEQKSTKILQGMESRLRSYFPKFNGDVQQKFEPKSWDNLKEQLKTEGSVVSGISAFTTVFICNEVETCYLVLGALHQIWKREVLSFQDFINAPAINGYRGLHTTIILEDGTRVRCKIRTQDMHEYARMGIATLCFKKGTYTLDELLPWTERINSVTQDTEGRSKEFFDSLQSDILGESITIHGAGDQATQVPKGSTALDGAFYLLGKIALKLKSISINGKQVELQSPLPHASTLDLSLSDSFTVNLQWINWTRTGLASALIRDALSETQSETEKLAIGKGLLQQLMNIRGKGFIEEFQEKSFAPAVKKLGYTTMDAIYKDIASGRLQAADIYTLLFESKSNNSKQKYLFTIHYSSKKDLEDSLNQLSQLKNNYGDSIHFIQYKKNEGTGVFITIKALLSIEDQRNLVRSLERNGKVIINVYKKFSSFNSLLVLGSLILLWGLDPVFAHALLVRLYVSPIDLTIVRFLSLTSISAILLLWLRLRSDLIETRLHLRNTSLWLSAALLVCVSLSGYFALKSTLPTHYSIPMTAAGLLLTSIVKRKWWKTLTATWILFIISNSILIRSTPNWPFESMLLTGLTVGCFAAFCIVSDKYKRREKVASRVAQYFFLLSFICGFLTLGLIPFSSLSSVSYSSLAIMTLFSILFAGVPYYIYYYLLSNRELDFILRFSFLLIIPTAFGQLFLLEPITLHTVFAAIIVGIAAILPLLNTKQQR